MPAHPRSRIVLASSSTYRRELLSRLLLDFECYSPEIDESPRTGEAPDALALRLACAKAAAVAPHFPDALVIGSDQVAMIGEQHLAKPGNHAGATSQLRAMSGHAITFQNHITSEYRKYSTSYLWV